MRQFPKKRWDEMDSILTEHEAKKLLAKYGIPVTKESIAQSPDEALAIASQIGTPVAMKISSPDISHKSDVGGVALNVSERDVKMTYNKIISRIKKATPEARIEGILVQQMAPPGHEVIVGLKKDAQFGHALMFGLGGIFVEVYKDVSFRVVPIIRKEALDMISEIKGYPILKGIRGRKPADIDAVARILVSVSEMVKKEKIIELDINPLIVSESGAVAVDARAMIEE
jgi:acyl-CoA synthetase (NDP forming)